MSSRIEGITVYNPCIIRPSADGNGFYGTDN